MSALNRHPNAILRRLPPRDLNLIQQEVKHVDLVKGAVLFQPDRFESYTYFPITSVISFRGDTGEGGSVEVWAVGNDGFAGLSSIVGRTKPFRGIVQVTGAALMMPAASIQKHFQKRSAFHDALLKYLSDLFVQISYLGICNNTCSIEQRLGRWLLMVQNRAQSSNLKFTQDSIAEVLGTRRATISVAAAALQNAGLIRYSPGTITIRSRKALERAACRCYKVISSIHR